MNEIIFLVNIINIVMNIAQCQLVNGTDVIVSTPSTFVRMLESGHVNVERLCHLIIDDADIVTKEFPTEVRLMSSFVLYANSGLPLMDRMVR